MSKLFVNVFSNYHLTENRLKRGALLYWSVLLALSAVVMHCIGLVKQPPHSGLLVAILLGLTVVQTIVTASVVLVPSRRLLIMAGAVEAIAMLLWIMAHTVGLPDGYTVWRPEMLGVPDLYLPVVEGVSAFFFLCLYGRTWTKVPRAWRIVLTALPSILIFGFLVLAVVNIGVTSLVLAIYFLDAQIPTSLEYFFFPAIGLLVLFLLLRLVFKRLRARTKGAVRTSLILLPAFVVLNLLTWGGGVSAADTTWFSAGSLVSAPPGRTTTLPYATVNGHPLAIDISEPSAKSLRPAPVVIYIHGGETLLGSRILEDGSADGMYFVQIRDELLRHGFVVCSIDYGLSPLYHVSSQVEEAKEAVRFLRAHASELGINPQRIGVYGPSQGGYIGAMLGTAGRSAGYDVGQYLNESSSVQAVVDMWGPTDLTNFSGSPSWISAITKSNSRAQLRVASPVTYVKHGDPPFLIIHGTDDWMIAPHHSKDMARLLSASSVPVTLVMVKHDGHGLDAPVAGQVEQPSPNEIVQIVTDFFTKTLVH